MSNIKDLVPPLDLCLKIPFPKKNFRDSLFAWVPRFKGKGEWREIVRYELYLRPTNNDSQCIPAPTLQEILAELPTMIANNMGARRYLALLDARNIPSGWHIGYTRLSLDKKDKDRLDTHPFYREHDDSPVVAAMKLWLNVNNIDWTDKEEQKNG